MLRVLVIAGVVVVVLAAGAVVWVALDLPPPRLVLAHGFPPAGGPTGRVKEIEGVRFVEIGTGYFRMGLVGDRGDLLGRLCKVFSLPWGRQPRTGGSCMPTHWVRIVRPYWIAQTELTNEQYGRFDPHHLRDMSSQEDRQPVVDIDWQDARRYCDWLSTRGYLAVRLPSESEWEYACRAGSDRAYCFGDDEAGLVDYAWFRMFTDIGTHEVMTKKPNRWGLFDLHGNVDEWVEDAYHSSYEGAPDNGRAWTEGGVEWKSGVPYRILRGGNWGGPELFCLSGLKDHRPPDYRNVYSGFRPAADSR